MTVKSRSPEDTHRIGRALGSVLRKGQTVLLFGELGAGKTVLAKGIAEALGIGRRQITSASFTIVQEHESPSGGTPLYHIDLYRIEGVADMEGAGVYEYIGGDGIAVVEWAERLGKGDAPGAIMVRLDTAGENSRVITLGGMDPGAEAAFSQALGEARPRA